MKPLLVLFFILTLATLACAIEFNPPPLSLTPPVAAATQTPVIILATPTFTTSPATATETLAASTATSPAATETLAPPTATSAGPTLSVEQLRNATLTYTGSDQVSRTIQLKDGKYETGPDSAQPGYVRINLGKKIAFGDLNGDGLADAAMTVIENYGGTGEFVSVAAVLNQNGQPDVVATMLIEDRAMLNDLSIQAAEIFVDATVHGPNDPECCASQPSKRFYRLIDHALVLSRLSTTTSNGAERVIRIETPADGAEVSSPFVIKGSVTISPFENSLTYTIFAQGIKDPLQKTGFTISADGLGGPGTFELPLDLTNINFKGPVRIEISDVSPANGSNLAVDTLYLILK
jgi:hypothetical protein